MRHLMSPLDLSKEELDDLLTLASDIEKNPSKYAHVCDDKRLATCFYEPSTKAKVLPIQFVLFPVMQISVLCVIRKKVLRS